MTDAIASVAEAPQPDLGDAVVLLDWNGTVVLDAERARGALNAAVRPHGIPALDRSAFGRSFRLPMAGLLRDLGVPDDGLTGAEAVWNAEMAAAAAPARPGAGAGLAALRAAGAQVGIVSAASEAAVRSDIERLGFTWLLDAVEAACVDKTEALVRLRGSRTRSVYVGDTEYDMRCALAAGFLAVGVTGGYAEPERLVEAGAARIVGDLRELALLPELGPSPTP